MKNMRYEKWITLRIFLLAISLTVLISFAGLAQNTDPKSKPLAKAEPTTAQAAPKLEPGDIFEDFESGNIGQLIDEGKGAYKAKEIKIVEKGKGKELFLEGVMHSRVFISDKKFSDCVVETRMSKDKGAYAGIVVREKVFVYFQMKDMLCVNAMNGGKLFQSDDSFKGYHNLKVVCSGPILRAYVDGKMICTVRIEEKEGRVGFYSHGNGEGYYDNFKVSTKIAPSDALIVETKTADGALVFSPGKNVIIDVSASNFSNKELPVEISAEAMTWKGKTLGKNTSIKLSVAGNGNASGKLELGAIPEGFHKIVLTARSGNTEIERIDDLPLAIQERGNVKFVPPVIPMAAYGKYSNKMSSIYLRTYAHAIGRIMHENNFNAIVADPSFTSEVVDILQQYGIATIARSGLFIEKPSVIGTLCRDEPKPDEIDALKADYEKIQAGGKLVTTCMIGECTGLGSENDPVNLWIKLDAKLRTFRWYGIKKSYYNTLYDLKYKGWLPLSSVFRIVDASNDTPWWFIPPSFGTTDHEVYYKNPTPVEMRAMMHLAMAYGTHGFLLFTLQSHAKWVALVEQESLLPTDGKLAAVGAAASEISKNADLLSKLRYGAFEIRNSNPVYVEAVPRRTEANNAYIYVVNKDANSKAGAKIEFKCGDKTVIKDIYSGREFNIIPGAEGFGGLDMALEPGQGALLDIGTISPVNAKPIAPLAGSPAVDSALTAKANAIIGKSGVAVLSANMPENPCISGDAIGLSRADDPRTVWKKTDAATRCFSWSGLVHERTAEGYLPLQSALRVADAYEGKSPYWTIYPAVDVAKPTPDQLRAMLHLALAYGSQAVLVSDKAAPELAAVVEEVSKIATAHGKTLANLENGGLDIRCMNAMIAAIPRMEGDEKNPTRYVYAINLDTEKTVTADILLWDDVWSWTKARDIFGGQELAVNPRNQDGYLSCKITLRPGEGKLFLADAATKDKKPASAPQKQPVAPDNKGKDKAEKKPVDKVKPQQGNNAIKKADGTEEYSLDVNK